MLQELRRAQPNISLAWMASHLPFRRDEREHFMEGLRRGVPSVGLPQVQGGRKTIRTGFNNRRENTNHCHAITRLGCGCFGSAYRAAADRALRLIQHHLAEPTMTRDDVLFWLSLAWFVAFCGAAIWVLLFPL